MPSSFIIFLLFGALLALQSAIALRDGFRFLRYVRRSLSAPQSDFHPRAALVVPVKGVDASLEASVSRLLAQDYPGYTLIFAVAQESDSAHAYLADRLRAYQPDGRAGPGAMKLVVAGLSEERGEKVNNLLAALRAVPPGTEVLAFADADARFKPGWLGALVGPLGDPDVTVSTGFRWYLPGRTFASKLRSAWDTSIATMFSEHRSYFAWGGSMAIRTADFHHLKVAERYWSGSVSDDYGLTRAVREAGGGIRFEPKCLVASSDEVDFRAFLHWSNRQIIITRVYAPHLWRLGLASHALFSGVLLFGLRIALAPGSTTLRLFALGLDAAIILFGLWKAVLRQRVASEVFPEETEALVETGSAYWRFWPLVPWVMLINFTVAGFTRRIEWRGVRYELLSPSRLRVSRP